LGISIPAIDAFRGASSRASLRAKHARAEDDLIIALEDARAERGSLRRDTTNALGRHAGRLQWFSLDQNQALPLSPTRGPSLPRRELLGMADLLVLGESHELHPRAMLEAMALGVPIVGPVLPGVSDVIAHETEGFVFAMSERDKVVQIVRRCVLDADLRRRLGHNAAIKVRRVLDTSRLADRHLELVRETILSGI
jgi:glycosyltransferase involved in cell wall biosynthesis